MTSRYSDDPTPLEYAIAEAEIVEVADAIVSELTRVQREELMRLLTERAHEF